LVVNVGGEDWDVTTLTGSYDANTSKFATAGNGEVMPWWGDRSLANQFTIAVGNSLGLPNVAGQGNVLDHTLVEISHPHPFLVFSSRSLMGLVSGLGLAPD
jgi:hypothetical protein